MGKIFSMYQTSEQELKKLTKDLVVALQLKGQHKTQLIIQLMELHTLFKTFYR